MTGNSGLTLLIFFGQIFLLYFISRLVINDLFHVLRLFIRKERIVFTIVTMLFLPGTIIHELSHFIVAISLMLRVREVSIFPKFEENYIRLGSVVYEKKDYIRGILVGIAPIFAGLFFFWFIGHFNLFNYGGTLLEAVLVYLIFVVSSTMFSSKQDLVDLVFIIPFIILIIGVIYIFNINLELIFKNQYLLNGILSFVGAVNRYLLFTILANIGFITIFRMIRGIKR